MKENPFQSDKLARIWVENFGDLIAAKRSYDKAISDLDKYVKNATYDAMTAAFGARDKAWKRRSERRVYGGGIEVNGRYLSPMAFEERGVPEVFWVGFTAGNNINKSAKPELELQISKQASPFVESDFPDQEDDKWMTVHNCADITDLAKVNAFLEKLKLCFATVRRKLDAKKAK